MEIDRLPPQDIEAEAAVLGCCMLDRQAQILCSSRLQAGDFYRKEHRDIFNAILKEDCAGVHADQLVLAERLGPALEGVGGRHYLHELAMDIPSSANVDLYVSIVKRKSVARRAIEACTATLRDLEEEYDSPAVVERGLERLFEITRGASIEEPVPIADVLLNAEKRTEERSPIRGIGVLEEQTGGFAPGGFVLIAGEEGAGKTTLAMQLVADVARQGEKVLVWSKDQRIHDLAMILWSSVAQEQTNKLYEKADLEIPCKFPIRFDRAEFSLPTILARLRMEADAGVRWFLLDSLALVDVPGLSLRHDWEKAAYSAKRIKVAVQELDVYFLMIQEAVKPEDKTPNPKYIAGGRAVLHAADQIWWIQRPPVTRPNDAVDLYVFKCRHSATGRVRLDYHGAHHYFSSWAGGQ